MVVDINNERINCPSFDEFSAGVKTLLKTDSAEVWISENGTQQDLPCLGVLINHNEYVIHYFGPDGVNCASIGNENNTKLVSFCNGQYTVVGYQVIDQETALRVILDFFRTQKPSKTIRWEEL